MTELELDTLLAGSLEEWVSSLPAYQAELITTMLKDNEADAVAELWLTNSGARDTAHFGGIKALPGIFYVRLLEEMKAFLCDGSGYEEERLELRTRARNGRDVVVATVSAALAARIGAAAVVVAPAVALVLAVLARAGRGAACETLAEMIATRTAAGG